MKKLIWLVILVLVAGCAEVGQIIKDETNGTNDVPAVVVDDGDGFRLDKVEWLGQNFSGGQEEQILMGATIHGDKIQTSYVAYSWPVKDGPKPVDAIVCLFYVRDGQWVGGKFDWWRRGGQGVKGLENVINGYGGHSMPSPGTYCREMIVSVDGKRRSNPVVVLWE